MNFGYCSCNFITYRVPLDYSVLYLRFLISHNLSSHMSRDNFNGLITSPLFQHQSICLQLPTNSQYFGKQIAKTNILEQDPIIDS
jgi:hypothetical protein